MVVGAHGTGTVAQVGLQQHQGAIAGLLQRLQLDPAAGGIHRSGQVARARPRRAEQIPQVRALAFERRSGVQQPVVVQPGQQVALVLGDGRGRVHQHPLVIAGRGRRHGRLPLDIEDAQVNPAGLGVLPAQLPGGHDEGALVPQDMAQVVQFAAQIGQGLRVRRVRPEQPGNPLPGLR